MGTMKRRLQKKRDKGLINRFEPPEIPPRTVVCADDNENNRNVAEAHINPPAEHDSQEMEVQEEEGSANSQDGPAQSCPLDGDAGQDEDESVDVEADDGQMNAALQQLRELEEISGQHGYRPPTEEELFEADVAYFNRLIQAEQHAEADGDNMDTGDDVDVRVVHSDGHQEAAQPRVYPPQRRQQQVPDDDDDDIQLVAIIPRRRRAAVVELRDFVPIAYAGRPAPKEGECVACMVDDATVAVVGCGHLCACGPCAIRIQNERSCPVCRHTPQQEQPLHMIAIFTGREKPPPEPPTCSTCTATEQSL